jgi:hypothetical protein
VPFNRDEGQGNTAEDKTKRDNMKRAIRITTTGEVTDLDISTDSLAQLQSAVGGLVQAVDLTQRLTMWLNEEGKVLGQEHNPYGQFFWDKLYGAHTDYIVGDIVITGGTDEEGDTLGLTDEQVEWVTYFIDRVRAVVEPSIKVFMS